MKTHIGPSYPLMLDSFRAGRAQLARKMAGDMTPVVFRQGGFFDTAQRPGDRTTGMEGTPGREIQR